MNSFKTGVLCVCVIFFVFLSIVNANQNVIIIIITMHQSEPWSMAPQSGPWTIIAHCTVEINKKKYESHYLLHSFT